MLWYYGVILMPLIVGIVLVLVLEATELETSLIKEESRSRPMVDTSVARSIDQLTNDSGHFGTKIGIILVSKFTNFPDHKLIPPVDLRVATKNNTCQ